MADVTKIKLPDNSEYNLKDHRIPGVDTTPTSGSNNVVTSGGIYDAMTQNEYVVAAAINDLNDRLLDVEDGAQSDWNQSDSTALDYIKNKPTIPDGLPSVTSSDNGKVLQVSNGDWAVANAPSGGDTNVIETVKVNSTALTPDASKAVDVTVPIEVIDLGTDPVSAPSGTYTRCVAAINAGRTVALRVMDSEDNEVYYYHLHSTGAQYAGKWQGLYFSRVAGNNIWYYSLSTNDNLTHSSKLIGTLIGVKFNNVSATVSNGVASITATIPAGLPSVSSSDNGKVLTVVSGDWAAATVASGTSGGVSDVTLGGTSVVSSGTAVLPAYPTVPTNVSSFTNDANYVKYVLCNNEAAYNAISNKDSETLYLIPVTS